MLSPIGRQAEKKLRPVSVRFPAPLFQTMVSMAEKAGLGWSAFILELVKLAEALESWPTPVLGKYDARWTRELIDGFVSRVGGKLADLGVDQLSTKEAKSLALAIRKGQERILGTRELGHDPVSQENTTRHAAGSGGGKNP